MRNWILGILLSVVIALATGAMLAQCTSSPNNHECEANIDCSAQNCQTCDLTSFTCTSICTSGQTCDGNGQCKTCTPNCTGKCGGMDGCNGTCPNNCGAGKICQAPNYDLCVDCTPSCSGKCSGPDGCDGTCPNNCPQGEVCSNGSCAANCAGSLTDCGGLCVDLQTDKDNCGACDTPCEPGQPCAQGHCTVICSGGEIDCNGQCADTSNDPKNCGQCGTQCTPSQVCSIGNCASSCTSGFTNCSGSCVDLQTDPDNCHSCGFSCQAGYQCVAGSCTVKCETGWINCGGSCVDPSSDPQNCGGCGTICGTGKICQGSACIPGGSVNNHGGTVDLLHFGFTGDTRPPACEDTAHYPTAIINSIADQFEQHGMQFAMDLGDHMYVCNNDLSVARAQMGMYMTATKRFTAGPWFMTQGNHECYHSPCYAGSTNANFVAFKEALAPVSSLPYYTFDIHTRFGLATFVVLADNSYDTAQADWLEATLMQAENNAKYTIILRHHPEGDSSVSTNAAMMLTIRHHKFSLFLTGHDHLYKHMTTDAGRDVVVGIGGAQLVVGGSFYGFGIVDQQADGTLKVSVYDISTGLAVDSFSLNPN